MRGWRNWIRKRPLLPSQLESWLLFMILMTSFGRLGSLSSVGLVKENVDVDDFAFEVDGWLPRLEELRLLVLDGRMLFDVLFIGSRLQLVELIEGVTGTSSHLVRWSCTHPY